MPDAPRVDKVRVFYNHPEFIAANAERVMDALERFSAHDHAGVYLAFTAHSIPCSMAQSCDYEQQLRETCRLVAEAAGLIEPGAGTWFTRAGAAVPRTRGLALISWIT